MPGTRLVPILATLSLSLLAACSALPTPVVLGPDSFNGMSALIEPEGQDQPLHVLIIHGMGTPAPYEREEFIRSLADRFGLVQKLPIPTETQPQGCYPVAPAKEALVHPVPRLISIDRAPENAWARLYTYNFARTQSGPRKLTVSYLLWAPLTESIKCDLADEETDAPRRQAFADLAKDFIDDKLTDVVLYGGTYRESVMRPSVQAALCYVINGDPSRDGKTCRHGDYSERTVIITHSLGGYMLMDAIDDELSHEKAGAAHGISAARQILENTQFIYMMANQLALLDLTTLDGYPHRLGGAMTRGGVAARFANEWSAIKLKSPVPLSPSGPDETSATKRQIVAFSDPNDILSWRLRRRDLKLPRDEWRGVRLTNVYSSNGEFSVPLLFSDPVTAHTGYFDNPAVMNMLVCGMDNGVVRTCPANAPNPFPIALTAPPSPRPPP